MLGKFSPAPRLIAAHWRLKNGRMTSNQPTRMTDDQDPTDVTELAEIIEGGSFGAAIKKKPPMFQGDASDLLPQLQLHAKPLEISDISAEACNNIAEY